MALRAVLFDFFGTVALPAASLESGSLYSDGYTARLAALGYVLEDEVFAAYNSRYEGIEHAEHSRDRNAYDAWVRRRHRELLDQVGVPDVGLPDAMEALRAIDLMPMAAYPEAVETLGQVKEAGLAVGICSNWGWDLDRSLAGTGLEGLCDVAVTSAQAGARKPHPRIFEHAIGRLGVEADEALFVGDSWNADVEGSLGAGMAGAVHVHRDGGVVAPALVAGSVRVADLGELLALLDAYPDAFEH
jgi:putative hydrolase of the HAD superfamily